MSEERRAFMSDIAVDGDGKFSRSRAFTGLGPALDAFSEELQEELDNFVDKNR